MGKGVQLLGWGLAWMALAMVPVWAEHYWGAMLGYQGGEIDHFVEEDSLEYVAGYNQSLDPHNRSRYALPQYRNYSAVVRWYPFDLKVSHDATVVNGLYIGPFVRYTYAYGPAPTRRGYERLTSRRVGVGGNLGFRLFYDLFGADVYWGVGLYWGYNLTGTNPYVKATYKFDSYDNWFFDIDLIRVGLVF